MQAPPDIWEVDPASPPDVVYFPVRHYSPASSRYLLDCASAIQPTAVLVEGPSHFNDRLAELTLDGHVLPVALYAYAKLSNGTTRSAFYPFTEYAPEWQAVMLAHRLNIPCQFIDLPWQDLAIEATREHRYSDEDLRTNPFPAALAARLHVEDGDDLWDVLFELDTTLDWREYLKRAHMYCWQLRIFGGEPSLETTSRERCMVRYIDDALAELGGPVLVVTGGFHCAGLWAARAGVALPLVELPEPDRNHHAEETPEELLQRLVAPEPEDVTLIDHGITLTPFTYERLDQLLGNLSGVQGPAYYQDVWERRSAGLSLDGRAFIDAIVKQLRQRGQPISTADVIAIETAARALATVRGRDDVWRFDLLDAISSALIKEPHSGIEHPVLQVARQVMCGDKRGAVDSRTPLPPLVANARAELEAHGLLPTAEHNLRVALDLEQPGDLTRSRLLNQCRVLRVAGFDRDAGTDFVARTDLSTVWEHWRISWAPEFDATLIEAATYGATPLDAAIAYIREKSMAQLNAVEAAELTIDAVLLGAGSHIDTLLARLAAIVRKENDFFIAARALEHVLYLYSYDEVLGAQGNPALRELTREVYLRTLWLFEGLGAVDERAHELTEAVKQITRTFNRCYQDDDADRAELTAIFDRTATDTTQTPTMRGVAIGALTTLGAIDTDRILAAMYAFADPMDLGDFLTGAFSLAREAALRDPRLLHQVDTVVCELSEDNFLETVPAMRLAFTFFTPREKYTITSILFPPEASTASIDAGVREEAAALQQRILEVVRRYSLRPTVDNLVEVSTATPEPPSSPTPRLDPEVREQRWHLILGGEDDQDGRNAQRNRLLAYIYDREYGADRNVRGGDDAPGGERGALDGSTLTIPAWINGVHELFPRRTIERLERDALERYGMQELVTQPDLLARATPSQPLLKAVLRTKHLMNEEVLQLARSLVRRVVQALVERLAREINQPFTGARKRRRTFVKIANNFDARETIRRNLKHYSTAHNALIVQDPYFSSRTVRRVDRWQMIILVDQSGSMLDSVIHAAVTASVFHGIRALRTHLIAFDTNIVDLTDDVTDPVEALMRVQLGGGTNIGNALAYATTLIENPRRTIVVLVSDFFEGAPPERLLQVAKGIIESGASLLGLAALDEQANPHYDRELASQLVELGAHVGAMTPGELADWVAEKIR